MAYAVLGLACLQGDREGWYEAALLHGASAALFEAASSPCMSPEDEYRRRSIVDGTQHLGNDEWHRAFTEGKTLHYREVLDIAISRRNDR